MNVTKEVFNKINTLPTYVIELGVFSAKTNRKETFTTGLTNAEIMFINEYGSAINHIPERPVLHYTIDWANKSGLVKDTIKKALVAWIEHGFDNAYYEAELEKMCIKLQNHARKLIYANDETFVDNSARTIAKKGVNHPLFDTGQLARSITARVVKK